MIRTRTKCKQTISSNSMHTRGTTHIKAHCMRPQPSLVETANIVSFSQLLLIDHGEEIIDIPVGLTLAASEGSR